jgi:hypothetical protein
MRFKLLATLVFASTAFAQHRSGAPASATRSGVGRTVVRRSFGGGAVYVPYPIYGPGYGYGPDYGFDAFNAGGYPGGYAPAYGGYDQGAAYPPTPTVIINQNFQTDSVHPQLRDYSNTPLPEPGAVLTPPPAASTDTRPAPTPAPPLADDQPTIFLIAMQDHSIIPVIAYWVQGDTLHYISLKGDSNQVSYAQVDRDFSRQLNAERHVPFALPTPR